MSHGVFQFWVVAGAFLGVAFQPVPGTAQEADPVGGAGRGAPLTTLDGVYTEAQADRGEAIAIRSCLGCHVRSEWTRPVLLRLWRERPLFDLHEDLRRTMPWDTPGSLSREEFSDVLAYILRLGGVPSGTQELPSDAESLGAILIVPPED